MKLVKRCSFILFIFNLSLTLLSCGQSKTTLESTKTKQKPPGSIVSELDTKASILYQDKKSNYWFGSSDNGVYKYDGKSLLLFTKSDGICSYDILSIQEDRYGYLYFDTPEGVCQFDGQKFTALEVSEDQGQKNEWKSEPDDLWFRMGWDSNGPYRYDGKHLYHLPFPKNEMEEVFYSKYPKVSFNPYGLYYIYHDKKGNIWFGTSSLGVYQFDGNNLNWMYEDHLTETPQGGSFGIRSITEDRDGYIWICNSNYKYKVLPTKKAGEKLLPLNYERVQGIEIDEKEDLYFMSMATDNEGDMWMVTFNNGVWRYNGKEFIQYKIKEGERNIPLFSIYKDLQGGLWIRTREDGSYKFNGAYFEKYKII